MKHFYLKRMKDGQVMAIRESDVADTLKQGFQMVGEVEAEQTAEVGEPEKVVENYQCPICGQTAKTERLLKMHKGKMHK